MLSFRSTTAAFLAQTRGALLLAVANRARGQVGRVAVAHAESTRKGKPWAASGASTVAGASDAGGNGCTAAALVASTGTALVVERACFSVSEVFDFDALTTHQLMGALAQAAVPIAIA